MDEKARCSKRGEELIAAREGGLDVVALLRAE
jgi:hypothetical protein